MTSQKKPESGDQGASAPEDTGPASPPDPGLSALVLIAGVHDIAANAEHLAHQYGRPGEAFSEVDLLRAAKGLGLKARAVDRGWDRLDRVPLPALARERDAAGGGWFVLAQAAPAQDKVLVHRGGKPAVLSRAELEDIWDGRLILIASRAGLVGEGRRFDLSWFIPAVVKYRKLFGEVLVASFFLQLFALLSPLFFQVIIDKVLTHRGLSSLDVLVFALVVVSVFEVLLGALRTYIFSHTTTRVDVELGASLFRHLLKLPQAWFGARRVGDTVARVRELETIRNFLTGSALTLVLDLVFTVVFIAVMFLYAPLLTWIVIGSIPFYAALSLGITPTLRRRVEEKFRRGAENHAFLTECVTGVETLKSLAVEPQMQRRWEEQLAGYTRASFRAGNLGNWAGQGVQLIQKLTLALTLWFGARMVMEGDLTIGQLVAFNMMSGRVSGPILRLAQLWQDFQQARIAIDRLGDILNSKVEPAAGAGRGALPAVEGRVGLDGITFRYRPDGQPVLSDVSLDVPAGQVVGIVGPSGSGKSTLTKLVQRLYVPEQGRVMIDGVDLALVDPAWLRRQVGVVLQENILFNRSVRDNIALANPALSLDAVVAAAEQAGAHTFIGELPEGYDTVLGERGSTLSGGQRQRIAIARALVTQPRILIFDEATSALDYESEQAVQANMKSICRGRTVFIIAHRLSAVRACDRIVTVEAGRIVEDGTHDTLLKSGGRYAKLWAAQGGPEEASGPATGQATGEATGQGPARRTPAPAGAAPYRFAALTPTPVE